MGMIHSLNKGQPDGEDVRVLLQEVLGRLRRSDRTAVWLVSTMPFRLQRQLGETRYRLLINRPISERQR